jgi:hypothetical protein
MTERTALQPPATGIARIFPDDLVPDRMALNAWWSDEKRGGEWILPRHVRAFACMGNVELDLTSARVGEGISVIDVLCVLGSVEIKVPADIIVVSDGDGIAGHFDIVKIGESVPAPGAPTLTITGTAYLGTVTVKVMGDVGPGLKDRLKAGLQKRS